MPVTTKQPVPSLGGKQVRHRPIVPVLLTGTVTPQLRDGLIDTGADDTDQMQLFSDGAFDAFTPAARSTGAHRCLVPPRVPIGRGS
jgi:hypothetical protein